MIKKEQIIEIQKQWGDAIIKIGSLKNDRSLCEKYTNEFLSKFYAFDSTKILFKPTKTSQNQFRSDKKSALSYFIGGDTDFVEDKGFAINPWKQVIFNKDFHLILEENRAIAMGNYHFIDMKNQKTKVEYTFGYKIYNGRLKIDLHHSSIPFKP